MPEELQLVIAHTLTHGWLLYVLGHHEDVHVCKLVYVVADRLVELHCQVQARLLVQLCKQVRYLGCSV